MDKIKLQDRIEKLRNLEFALQRQKLVWGWVKQNAITFKEFCVICEEVNLCYQMRNLTVH